MPARNEELADYYLKVAGIAAVYIDAQGEIWTQDLVGIGSPAGCISFCCMAGDEVRLARLMRACSGDQAAIATNLEGLAEVHGIGLTPHRVAVDRALAAVAAVNETFEKMQNTGGMRQINSDFKATRMADPTLRYHDFLHTKKAAMLEAIARQK